MATHVRIENRALTTGLLLLQLTVAQALQNPNAFLFGASLSNARAFAVENAKRRGWSIQKVTASTALFEQILEGDETDGVLVVRRLLRVRAEFTEESAGIRVYLSAEEVEWPATDREWMSDVTERYTDNLMNALSSLRDKWDAQRDDPASLPSSPSSLVTGKVDPGTGRMAPEAVGTWAYAAERYAQSRGCELTDRTTELESSGQDWEQHRVFCQDGTQIIVRCRYGDCTTRP